jgi:hypothetical protein
MHIDRGGSDNNSTNINTTAKPTNDRSRLGATSSGGPLPSQLIGQALECVDGAGLSRAHPLMVRACELLEQAAIAAAELESGE